MIGLIIIAVLVFFAMTYIFGLAGLTSIVAVVAVLFLLKGFTKYANKMPLSPKLAKYVGVILVVPVIAGMGIMSGIPILSQIPSWDGILGGIPSASVLGQPLQDTTTVNAACQVNTQNLGDAATADLNTWDLESNTPYSAAIDLTTNCHYFKNGNAPMNYVAVSADTAAEELSHWAVGDTAYIYCGGSSYYTDPMEGVCIDSERPTLNLKTHAAVATTNLVITCYDNTGAVALTAAGNTTTADYDVTMGASEETTVYCKIKNNVANKAYNVGAIAVGSFNDIDEVTPVGVGAVQVPEPDWLDSVSVSDDDKNTATNVTVTYDLYMLNSPILLTEWEETGLFQFKLTSGTTDPTATDNVFSTIDGAIICFLDSTYAKGSDGKMYLDVHDHSDAGEADIGIANTVWSPVQKDDCVVIEGN